MRIVPESKAFNKRFALSTQRHRRAVLDLPALLYAITSLESVPAEGDFSGLGAVIEDRSWQA